MQPCENRLKHYKRTGSFMEGKMINTEKKHTNLVLLFLSSKFKKQSLSHCCCHLLLSLKIHHYSFNLSGYIPHTTLKKQDTSSILFWHCIFFCQFPMFSEFPPTVLSCILLLLPTHQTPFSCHQFSYCVGLNTIITLLFSFGLHSINMLCIFLSPSFLRKTIEVM